MADGVGGWRSYGIDPGEFSSFLMKTCERLVHCGNFNPQRPVNLLAYSYCELLEQKKPVLGKFKRKGLDNNNIVIKIFNPCFINR